MKILMVCLGNICRSPLAEGIMKSKVHESGLEWIVDSAGTAGYHVGDQPDPRSIAVAKKFGIDITDQRARQFQSRDLDVFDLVLAMDSSNYEDILAHSKGKHHSKKVKRILEFRSPNRIDENSRFDVPDPYYGGADGFEKVFDMLDDACSNIIKQYNHK